MNSSNGNINGNNIQDKQSPVRILIVDDQRMIREGLKALLQSEPDFEVVGTAENGYRAIEQVEQLQPDVVLIDMEMPELDGVEATKIICERFVDTKILVLSTHNDDRYVTQSLEAGAKGYLLKGTPAHEVREAIRAVHKGYFQVGPGLFDKIAPGQMRLQGEKLKQKELVASSIAKSSTRPKLDLIFKDTPAPEQAGGLTVANQNREITLKDYDKPFEQGVILRQSSFLPRAITWSIISVTAIAIGWSAIAKIEQVIPAQGQLKPQGKVKEVLAPTNGVVKEVYVAEGDIVKKDQPLLILDYTASQAELDSLKKVRTSLSQENQFYRSVMNQLVDNTYIEKAISQLKIPREIVSLAKNRVALLEENKVYQIQLGASPQGTNLTPEQQARIQVSQTELNSRAMAAKLEMEQLSKQLNQNQVKIVDYKQQLQTNRSVLAQMINRNQKEIAQAESSLAIEEGILNQVKPIAEEGALARVQLQRQQQQVNDRLAKLVELRGNGSVEVNNQQQKVESNIAEIQQLQEEAKRLIINVNKAKQQLINTTSTTAKDILEKLADNGKRIAEIDTQLNKIIIENDKKLAETNSQISRSEQSIKYQALKAPVAGKVFDLKASVGYVPQPGPTEPVMKIVPEDSLVAEVFVTNKDLGFVKKVFESKQDLKVDVRIDSFDFNEFGDIKGKVISIGSDALPPDQTYNYFRFPVKIELNQQQLKKDGISFTLQSGMSVNANLKINENRTVLSLLMEQFSNGVEAFKGVK
jgi:HlyD family secretion protein